MARRRYRPSILRDILLTFALVPTGQHEMLADTLTLKDVLFRAHAYVVEYEDHQLSGVLAEERYEQRISDRHGAALTQQTLVSEYLTFQLPPDESWFAFRNVLEVDGVPVPDSRMRFQELLSGPSSDVVEQVMKIGEESARYNIGDVYRTINLPTFALAFLRPINRKRVSFEKAGEETIEGTPTWVIHYEDLRKPAFITTPSGSDLKTSGRFWIDPVSGRVIRSELITGGVIPVSMRRWGPKNRGALPNARITVTYRPDHTLGFWVPAEMEETYDDGADRQGRSIAGTAKYSNFRRVDSRTSPRRIR